MIIHCIFKDADGSDRFREDVAERIRLLLKHVEPESLYLSPDCGFFQLPRWLTYLKLESMVAGTEIVRRELGG